MSCQGLYSAVGTNQKSIRIKKGTIKSIQNINRLISNSENHKYMIGYSTKQFITNSENREYYL